MDTNDLDFKLFVRLKYPSLQGKMSKEEKLSLLSEAFQSGEHTKEIEMYKLYQGLKGLLQVDFKPYESFDDSSFEIYVGENRVKQLEYRYKKKDTFDLFLTYRSGEVREYYDMTLNAILNFTHKVFEYNNPHYLLNLILRTNENLDQNTVKQLYRLRTLLHPKDEQ